MLPVEQVIPFIRHPDPMVVNLAVECLRRVRWPHRLNGEFILDAIEAGDEDNPLFRFLDDFEPTAKVLEYAVSGLESAPCGGRAPVFVGILDAASDFLLTPDVRQRVGRLVPRLSPDWVQERTRHRLQFLDWETDRIRDRLAVCCRRDDEEHRAMSVQREEDALCERLVSRGDSCQWAVERLASIGEVNSWLEIWLYRLLARSRYLPVLPLAIDRLLTTSFDQNEALTDETLFAISELAQPGDVPRLEEVWRKLDGVELHSFVDAVGNLRFAEAEPLLLRIGRESTDPVNGTFAAIGLCQMLATLPESREFVRDLTDCESFAIEEADLESYAIPYGIILGEPFEEESSWRSRIENPEVRSGIRREKMRAANPTFTQFADLVMRMAAAQLEKNNAEFLEDVGIGSPKEVPVTRTKTAGRNDPCPCGSGKKYKKCCLKTS